MQEYMVRVETPVETREFSLLVEPGDLLSLVREMYPEWRQISYWLHDDAEQVVVVGRPRKAGFRDRV